MGDRLVSSIVAILTAIIGVAIIAALVSKNAQTPQVLQAAGTAFSGILGSALGPITGNGSSLGGMSQGVSGLSGEF